MNDKQLQTGKPIVFSAEGVRGIQSGHITQTRSPLNPQPEKCSSGGWIYDDQHFADDQQMQSYLRNKCPYGVGDLLWVRETWLEMNRDDWCDPSKPEWWFDDCYNRVNAIAYRANCDAESEKIRREHGYKWRSSRHMPRWASRITLRVTDVRVERVQELTEADVKAEGVQTFWVNHGPKVSKMLFWRLKNSDDGGWTNPFEAYENLWDSINAKRGHSWDRNPWAWVVGFEKAQRSRACLVNLQNCPPKLLTVR